MTRASQAALLAIISALCAATIVPLARAGTLASELAVPVLGIAALVLLGLAGARLHKAPDQQ